MSATLIALPTASAPPFTPAGTPGLAQLRQLAGRYDGPREIGDQLRLAAALADARFAVPEMYRGNPGDVLASMYQAMALDVPVVTALQQFSYNNGKGGMSGALMLALIIRAGHKVVPVGDPTDRQVEMELVRCDDQPGGRAKWTLAEASVAGLTGKTAWKSYPGDLLYWRCLARLARRFAADVVQGFGYTPEELTSMTVDDVEDSASQGDRPVDPDVQALLADLDILDYEGARKLWSKARKMGAADRYAGMVDGRAWTVEQLIVAAVERLRAAAPPEPVAVEVEAAVLADEVADLAAGEGTLPCGCDAGVVVTTGEHPPTCALLADDDGGLADPVDETPAAAEPVVDDAPPWAVDADTNPVLAAVDPPASDDIADMVASAKATLARLGIPAQPAAADEPAPPPPAEPDDGDVLVPLLPCGCNPNGVPVNGHRRNCSVTLAAAVGQ